MSSPVRSKDYYKQRKIEIFQMRFDEKKSLQYIGDCFDITRERVRQIVGNSGKGNGGFYAGKYINTLRNSNWLLSKSHLTTNELANLLIAHPKSVSRHRGKLKSRHVIEPNTSPGIGSIWEEWASNILYNNNIKNTLMPYSHPFDILSENGARIDVKVAIKPLEAPSLKNTSAMYRFSVKGAMKRNDTDFYMLIIAPEKTVFIVPSKEVPLQQKAIVFCYPTDQPCTKWHTFQDRYDLIKDF